MTDKRIVVVVGSTDAPLVDAPLTVGALLAGLAELANWLLRSQVLAGLVLLWAGTQAVEALTAISGMAIVAEAPVAEALTAQAQQALDAARWGAVLVGVGFGAGLANRLAGALTSRRAPADGWGDDEPTGEEAEPAFLILD
ncbi:MAG TPA: hypothetical protein PKD55_00875 [Bellilinea sp.]|nr:hypothetical protein [Bellilinea sp.]